tara:strand:+ start:845 stop:1663 length:819 start_codon:yes stop_codon:yes gene_type:complete
MTNNLDRLGVKSIISNYDLFFIDIWGVVHNGISLFESSIDVLKKIEELDKQYVLLTNAPRPNAIVRKFLENMGLDNTISKKVYTSGEAALDYLTSVYKEKKFFHIGPPKDFDLFKLFEKNKMSSPDKADYLLCTGLFEDQDKNLDFYEQLLKNEIKKKMICTNPDLIVDRGKVREYCAGSVAKVFEKIGGKVEYFGKPYPNVYSQSTNIKDKKILCIGDNLNTDIRGANLQNFSSLFISSGIHRNEFDENQPEILFNKYNVTANYFQSNLKW